MHALLFALFVFALAVLPCGVKLAPRLAPARFASVLLGTEPTLAFKPGGCVGAEAAPLHTARTTFGAGSTFWRNGGKDCPELAFAGPDDGGPQMPKLLETGLVLYFLGALVAMMAIGSRASILSPAELLGS